MGKRSGMLSPEIIQSGPAPLRIGVPPSENVSPMPLESIEKKDRPEPIKEVTTRASVNESLPDTQVIDISLDLIDDNPYNARQIYNDADIQGLASSIHRESQLQPIVVTPNSERPGRYIGIDGKRRRLAIELLGDRKTIQAKIVPAEDAKKLYLISYTTNEEREQHTDLDNGLSWAKLLEDKVFSNQSELARALGKDRTVINKALCYSHLPETILDVFRLNAKQFSINFATEVYGLFNDLGENAAIAFARFIYDTGCSIREARIKREKISLSTETTGRARSRKYPVVANGAEIGSVKEWDSGRMVVELSGLSESERAKIRALFAEALASRQ